MHCEPVNATVNASCAKTGGNLQWTKSFFFFFLSPSTHSAFQLDAHLAQRKSAFFMNALMNHQGILPSMTCILHNESQPFSIVWADDTEQTTATKQTQHDPRRPAQAFVDILMVRQPLPPSHLPPLSHILSFPAMLLRQHLLLLQEYLREFTLARVTS
jgi:hypothetical protein